MRNIQCHIIIIFSQYNVGRNWTKYVQEQIKQWTGYFHVWLANGIKRRRPVHVIKYEDLKLDTLKGVKGMLDFLQFEHDEEELRGKIATDFNTFHR